MIEAASPVLIWDPASLSKLLSWNELRKMTYEGDYALQNQQNKKACLLACPVIFYRPEPIEEKRFENETDFQTAADSCACLLQVFCLPNPINFFMSKHGFSSFTVPSNSLNDYCFLFCCRRRSLAVALHILVEPVAESNTLSMRVTKFAANKIFAVR